MIFSAKKLFGRPLLSADMEEIGKCHDLLFESGSCQIRYLVLQGGPWIAGRETLIPPQAVLSLEAREDGYSIPIRLTKPQVAECPEIDAARPISRELEERYFAHYGWTPYWTGGGMGETWQRERSEAPSGPRPTIDDKTEISSEALRDEMRQVESSLQSARELFGYTVHTSDKQAAAKVADFHVDSEGWRIERLIADEHPLLPVGRHVVPCKRIREIDTLQKAIYLDATREQLKAAPTPPNIDNPVPESAEHLLENELAHPRTGN
jgi:sporulation protein YlmC with PRC-barrel domain